MSTPPKGIPRLQPWEEVKGDVLAHLVRDIRRSLAERAADRPA